MTSTAAFAADRDHAPMPMVDTLQVHIDDLAPFCSVTVTQPGDRIDETRIADDYIDRAADL